jgi:hypothetical protein
MPEELADNSNVKPAEEDASAPQPPELSDVNLNVLYSVVEQMANLLSDATSFRENVRKKVADKQLAPEWNDVVEMLPNQPLLKKVGEEWYWLFDINANPLQVPEPQKEVGAPPAMQPVKFEPGQVAYIEDKIRMVDGVNEAVQFYTESRLNLETLGAELRLLAISPDYSTFSLSVSNYRASAGPGPLELTYSSLPSDKSVIEEYSHNLGNAIKAIKRFLFLGELLVYWKTPTPFSRLRTDTLRLLAGDLDFDKHSTSQIDALLAEFSSDFEPYEQQNKALFDQIATENAPLNTPWVQSMQQRLNEIFVPTPIPNPPPGSANPMSDPIGVYFQNRSRALILHARNKKPLIRLTLIELKARVGSNMPPFHGDPDTIPLFDYANALNATKLYPTPNSAVFAILLLAKLGFGKELAELIFKYSFTFAERTADLAEAARVGWRPGERVFLVLGGASEQRVQAGQEDLLVQAKGLGSSLLEWRISPTHAVLPVHRDDIGSIAIAYPGANDAFIFNLEFTMTIIDEGVPVVAAPGVPSTPVYYIGTQPLGRPTGLDEAVTAIQKNNPPTPPNARVA